MPFAVTASTGSFCRLMRTRKPPRSDASLYGPRHAREENGLHVCPHCRGTGWIIDIDPAVRVKAIAAAIGSAAFTTAGLIECCAIDEELGEALGDLTPRRLGKLLRKLAGQDFSGLTIEKIGEERDGAIWRIAGLQQTHLGPF